MWRSCPNVWMLARVLLKRNRIQDSLKTCMSRLGGFKWKMSGSKEILEAGIEERKQWLEIEHKELTLARQCELLNLSRSGVYYHPVSTASEVLKLTRLKTPTNHGGRGEENGKTGY